MRDNAGRIQGYVALRLTPEKINAIVQDRTSLGRTGETYLVGMSNGVSAYRSDRVIKEGRVGDPRSGSYVDSVLDGQAGQVFEVGSTGVLEFSAYEPLDLPGLNWGILTTMAVKEILNPQLGEQGLDLYAYYVDTYGYQDMFLIDSEGFIFYSVLQEADYETNLIDGPYADSNLGELVREVMETRSFGFTDFAPYEPSGGKPAAFLAEPFIHEGKVEFVVAVQMPLDEVNAITGLREGMGESGHSYLVGPDYRMRSDAYLDSEEHSVAASFAGTVAANGADTEAVRRALAGNEGQDLLRDYRGERTLATYGPVDVYDETWALITEVDQHEINRPITTLVGTVLLIAGAIAVIVVVVAFLVAKSIASPLVELTAATRKIADGNLDVEAEVRSNDEVGVLAANFNRMVRRLRGILGSVQEAANNLNAATAEILAATTQQASGASEQSAAITQTSTTVDEVKAISEQAISRSQEVADTSRRTVEVSRSGREAVQETIDSMNTIKVRVSGIAENILALSDKTQKIGEIIASVGDIAAQSNMLALNASVEAARAGEHGKGFAVVATEVRSLAEQSKQATAQVRAILTDIQNAINASVMVTEAGAKVVDEGVLRAAEARQSIEQLATVINESAQISAQVAAGGQQQAAGVEQIALAIQNINTAMQQSLASTRQTEQSAQELNELSAVLKEKVQQYTFSGNGDGRSEGSD